MPATLAEFGIDRLPLGERLALMHDIWDSVTAERPAGFLTESQREELKRRIAQDDASPDDLVPGDQVWAAVERRANR